MQTARLPQACSVPAHIQRVTRLSGSTCSWVMHASGVSAALGFNVMPLPTNSNHLVEASMDQLGMALPAWAIRAGARRVVFFDPSQVRDSMIIP